MSLALFEHRCFSKGPFYERNLCSPPCLVLYRRALPTAVSAKLKSRRQRNSVADFCYKFQDQVTSATVESPGPRRARTGSPNLNSIKRVSRRLENVCTPCMAGACNPFRCAVERLTIACRPQRSFARRSLRDLRGLMMPATGARLLLARHLADLGVSANSTSRHIGRSTNCPALVVRVDTGRRPNDVDLPRSRTRRQPSSATSAAASGA